MIVLAALAVGFAAQEVSPSRARITVFVLVLSGLIFIIIDFDNLSRGLIRLNQDSLIKLVADMEGATPR